MSESKRRTRRGDASDAANIKLSTSTLGGGAGSLLDKFKNSVAEKNDRQNYRDALDVAYKRQSDKKKIEMEKFKSEMAKMLDSDSEDEEKLRIERRNRNKTAGVNGAKKPGKLKMNWDKQAQEKKEAEQQKLDRERKRREKQDRLEKKKAKRELEEKGETAETMLSGQNRAGQQVGGGSRKPTKNPDKLHGDCAGERRNHPTENRYGPVQ